MIKAVATALALLLLTGCDKEDPAAIEARAKSMKPHDARLAEIYERACRNCHTVRDAGAPLTGDAKAWAKRLEQGMDALIAHATQGFKNMPPRGLCPDCTADDYRALIAFMSAKP
jgi:cytochrome c5